MNKYWKECIEEALEEEGIEATDEQIINIADAVQGAHENYSMYMGHECISNPLETENKNLKKELEKEKEKIWCKHCRGTGRITTYGGTFQSESRCYKCDGTGKV